MSRSAMFLGTFLAIVAVATATIMIGRARAGAPPTCPAPPGVALATSLRTDLPPSLRDALNAQAGALQDADQPFDSTDVVETGHSGRFAFAWHIARRWVVATERGGIAYYNPVFAYDIPENAQAILVEKAVAYPDSICEVAEQLLALPSSIP